ncbi:hypothetical protein BDN72DRAFT_869384 [Pluteus cervinus]|uniref:Uncharacterized protein n=1 Tax=Pluteus cervinus TaxID=181527 RepID=A0ACD3B4Q8_9AGAR|nr:hypothetical protein BDN72DRAFT_869384 [Pluteus cervinus]
MLARSSILATLIYTTTSIFGARLSASGAAATIDLLPGQYTSSTSPQLLHDLLTSSSASLTPSPGFNTTSAVQLPLNLALQPGFTSYSGSKYSGQASFSSLSNTTSNSALPSDTNAIALSSNVWVALASRSSNNTRVVLWDSVPDISQLPQSNLLNSLSVIDIQSTTCSPPCAGSGVCSASGTCICPAGFTGSSCETCSPGFFGPTCQKCPDNCQTCDDGTSGTGKCLKPQVQNPPSSCNCLNGVCGSNGQCACSTGFTTASNGTACAKCASGFFLSSTGSCQVCQLGCAQCSDGTGACTACESGFTQDSTDRTKCNPPREVTSTGTVCPSSAFSNGGSCSPCASQCQTCTGGTANDCVICASGTFALNGACVGVNSDGVCSGTNLIADNIKKECDSCGPKCTTCRISGFNAGSLPTDVQCTGCLPGFVLSQGQCVESCPSGTFLSPQDNLTCQPCDSSCGTCVGSSTFCLTCSNNQLASNGRCVTSCPSNTFSSSGSCLSCHPDCATCSGSGFNQCTSCPADRPILNNGRCLCTCSKTQFFDPVSSSCQTCDSSCSSCSGPGPSNCLACSSPSQVLRQGSCAFANCQQSNVVVSGLGVCLSELVLIPDSTDNLPPLPSVSGLYDATKVVGRKPLEWWQILLMALGCAFIFLVIVWLFRRRKARKEKQKNGEYPASTNPKEKKAGWKWRLVRFGEKLFGHRRTTAATWAQRRKNEKLKNDPDSRGYGTESEASKLMKLRAAEEARGSYQREPQANGGRGSGPALVPQHEEDIVKLIGSYNKPSTPKASKFNTRFQRIQATSAASPNSSPSVPLLSLPPNDPHHNRLSGSSSSSSDIENVNRLSAPSLYSQMTGMPRRTPEPRRPVRPDGELLDVDALDPLLKSRFSMSSFGSGGEKNLVNGKGKGKEENIVTGTKCSFWK